VLSLLRAVEQRRWLVRASSFGPSAIVDPFGRVVARTRPFERATLVGEIGVRSERSLYSRVGDLFAFLCLAAVLGALLPWRGALRRARDR
jgi:apolipoprotein N-acyltransferase